MSIGRQDNHLLVAIACSALSTLGVFLPWGNRIWFVYSPWGPITGIELFLGDLALLGGIIMLLFLCYRTKREGNHLLVPVVIGSFVVIVSTLLWILYPQTNNTHLQLFPTVGIVSEPFRGYSIEIAYGAYITLIGALLVATSIHVKWIFGRASSNKSSVNVKLDAPKMIQDH